MLCGAVALGSSHEAEPRPKTARGFQSLYRTLRTEFGAYAMGDKRGGLYRKHTIGVNPR